MKSTEPWGCWESIWLLITWLPRRINALAQERAAHKALVEAAREMLFASDYAAEGAALDSLRAALGDADTEQHPTAEDAAYDALMARCQQAEAERDRLRAALRETTDKWDRALNERDEALARVKALEALVEPFWGDDDDGTGQGADGLGPG